MLLKNAESSKSQLPSLLELFAHLGFFSALLFAVYLQYSVPVSAHEIDSKQDSLMIKKSNDDIEPKLAKLATARNLEDERIGEGEPSGLYALYRELVSRLDEISLEQLDSACRDSTGGGRIYAALLLKSKNDSRGKEALKRLQNDESVLTYQSGCEKLDCKTGEAAKALLENGDFLGFKAIEPKTKSD